MGEFDWDQFVQRAGQPGGGGPEIPDIELDLSRILRLVWTGVAGAILILGVLDSYYTVEANEEAVVLRFGAYSQTVGPGIQAKIPFVDRVYKGEVKTVHRSEFGYRTLESGVKSRFDYTSPEVVSEATMLSADLNIAMVSWEVRYKIQDLKNYLFEVRNPVLTLRDISEAVMRIEVGDRSVDEVLTLDRTVIENSVMKKIQDQLNVFKCGIRLVSVNLKRVDPPDEVRDAFNAVNQAIQVRDRIVNEAEGTRNKRVPAARGKADRMVKEAEGYAVGRKNRSQGETEAFLSVLTEYRKAEDITRRRLYIEALEKTLPNVADITVLDEEGSGVLKLLDLNGKAQGVTK